MDFGSSHVYYGSVYYSDVPREEEYTAPIQSETLYESVGVQSQNREEGNVYDPVYNDAEKEERATYDLVPYEPELDNTNKVKTKHPPPVRSISTSVFHKALKVTGLKKKKQTKSTSDVSDVPPPLPAPRPNSILSKPLPPIPQDSNGAASPPLPPSLNSMPTKQKHKNERLSVLEQIGFERPLYPALPNVYSYESSGSILKPTAPPNDMTPIPSAPMISDNSVKKDNQSKEVMKSLYAAADTNIVSVKMSILEKMENSMIWGLPPQKCASCQAVLLHRAFQNEEDENHCRFCGESIEAQQEGLPLVGNESDVTYILNQGMPVANDDPIIVFCIDTSGSMCVTTEVSLQSKVFMSRLQAVKDGIVSQINWLRQANPKVRIAIVTFSNTVVYFGDGSQDQYSYLNDAQLYDTDYIKSVVAKMPLPGYLGHTHALLLKTTSLLKEHGGTALGPALFLSVALAAKKCGSQVIVCTDGRANVGIGSLELESDYKMCHNFYKETGDFGCRNGVMVSIISIEGTDCRLVELGKIADNTAGKIKIGSVDNISNEFKDVLTTSLMATNVEINIATQKELFFREDKHSEGKSMVSKFVGNITRDSEVTFKYGVKETNVSNPPENAFFQLQVKFQLRNGCTCLRVITQERPVTESRMVAEQGLNPAVVGTYASQLASKLVLDGELRDAKLTTEAHKSLINRALSVRSNAREQAIKADEEKIYGTVCANMDEINREIKKVVKSVEPAESGSDVPPPLPPRQYENPKNLSRSSSMSSLSLPDVPNHSLDTKEKFADAVAHCTDDVATKLYKHRNACQGMFSAC